MSEGKKPVGIRVSDDKNRIKARAELITNSLDGLFADLGAGFFVVTKDAAEELVEKGVDYEEVEIVNGVPSFVREFIKDTCRGNGVISPF